MSHPPLPAPELPDNGALVEGVFLKAHDLVGLVALPGQEQQIAGPGFLQGGIEWPPFDRRSGGAEPSPIPATTSSMMASGSSVRGLSEVTNDRSANRAATAPMWGRFPVSRSPPAPKRTRRRP